MAWKITIDRNICAGSGLCCVYAPETFDIDAEAKSYVRDSAGDAPDAIETAAEACPMSAISLERIVRESEPGYAAPDFSLVGAEHVSRYVQTDGAVGHDWNGAPCLILTTTGRCSGGPHATPLIYGHVPEGFVVVASQGGAPRDPQWYRNLAEKPEVDVQVRGERFRATARDATPAERDRMWRVMTSIWPNYDVYARRTTRKIPVVVLEPLTADQGVRSGG